MKRQSTAERLKFLMEERNLKQVDILNLSMPICNKYDIKMNKSDISQYVSGKTEPSQEKLVVLGMALNVSESWLMGFDVPMNRNDNQCASGSQERSKGAEPLIMTYYNRLNSLGKIEATKRVEELTYFPRYITPDSSGSNHIEEDATPLVVVRSSNQTAEQPAHLLLRAAHAEPDATEEDIAFDDTIMNDENF